MPTTGNPLLDVAAAVAALGVILAAARGLWRWNRRLVHIYDAVQELTPNGGTSVVDRVRDTQNETHGLTERLDRHLESHTSMLPIARQETVFLRPADKPAENE